MIPTITNRGFGLIEFRDRYDQPCSLQESSADEPSIWLGCVEGKHIVEDNQVKCMARMHLSREQVAALLPYLLRFVETGLIVEEKPQ